MFVHEVQYAGGEYEIGPEYRKTLFYVHAFRGKYLWKSKECLFERHKYFSHC